MSKFTREQIEQAYARVRRYWIGKPDLKFMRPPPPSKAR